MKDFATKKFISQKFMVIRLRSNDRLTPEENSEQVDEARSDTDQVVFYRVGNYWVGRVSD